MDCNLEIRDSNKIINNDTDNIQSSNLICASLSNACEVADTNCFDVQSVAVAAKDDFSILWNDQTQTHSKLMDANLDDIEMNDELLDKLVTAILQDNTLVLQMNSEASNQSDQLQLSCNQEIQEPNSTIGVSDNTLQVWQKLLEGDNTIVEPPPMKWSTNPSMNPRSASQTPKPFVRRISEDIFSQSVTRARSQLIRASTPHKALREPHFKVSSPKSFIPASFAQRIKVDTINLKNQESHSTISGSPESLLTSNSGPMTRSRSASKASQSDSHSQLNITPEGSTRYYLRARSSAGSQSNVNLCSSLSRNLPNIRQKTHKDSNFTPSHKYQTRSQTSSHKSKVEATDRCCTKLAVVVQRVRMSMIARLRCGRSSIRLPTPQKKLQPRRLATSKTRLESRLPTPKKRQQPQRLCLGKTKILAYRKSSRHVSSIRKR